MKWIMLANSNDCRIYEYDKNDKHLALVEEISHPENRLKGTDYWTSDAPGHYRSQGTHHGSYTEPNPREQSIDDFANEIARRLEKGRNQHAFEDVCAQDYVLAREHGFVLRTWHDFQRARARW